MKIFFICCAFLIAPALVFAQNNKPVANAGDDIAAIVGQEILFDASFSWDPNNLDLFYFWNFDDGTRGHGPQIMHSYSIEGDYYVKLRVDNGTQEDDDVVRVIVVGKLDNAGAIDKYVQKKDSNKFVQSAEILLKQAVKLPKDTDVITRGVVLVRPGIFAKTYFYIGSDDTGAQVYFHSGEFPDLRSGQLVEVNGTISTYYNMPRIKILEASDITVLGAQDEPEAVSVQPSDISDKYLAQLIKIQGKIIKEDSKIFISDSGSRLRLEIKKETGIVKTSIKEGNQYIIVGILDKTRSGYRLLPRWEGDISNLVGLSDQIEVLEKHGNNRTQTAQELIGSLEFAPAKDQIILSPNSDTEERVFTYLLIISVALGAVLILRLIFRKGS